MSCGKMHADRSLNNTYNLLSAESPLRPVALLALVQLLGEADDLAALPLTPATLNTALSLWAVSDADKVSFLTDAAAVYEPAGDLEHALTLSILALERSINPKTAEHALALAIAIPDRFDLDDLLKVQGVRDALTGHAAELVALFTTVDELEAVAEASKWVAANESYVSGLGVQGLDAEEVVRKVRLIALTTLAARSSTKELAYADLASTLGVKEDEVEAWVIDGEYSAVLSNHSYPRQPAARPLVTASGCCACHLGVLARDPPLRLVRVAAPRAPSRRVEGGGCGCAREHCGRGKARC